MLTLFAIFLLNAILMGPMYSCLPFTFLIHYLLKKCKLSSAYFLSDAFLALETSYILADFCVVGMWEVQGLSYEFVNCINQLEKCIMNVLYDINMVEWLFVCALLQGRQKK